MPIRGENIGTAYVRIIGDGSDLPDSIEKAFDEAEPSVRQGAKEHGEAYDEAMAQQLRRQFRGSFGKTKREIVDGLNNSLNEAVVRMELSEKFFASREWKAFTKRLEAEGGAAGRLLARELADEFSTSGNLDELEETIRNLGPRLRAAQRTIVESFDETTDSVDRASVSLETFESTMRGLFESIDDLGNRIDESNTSLGTLPGILDETGDAASGASEEIDGLNVSLDDTETRVRRGTLSFAAFRAQLDRMGDGVGRAFGRGARNDFVNFIGVLARGVFNIVALIPKAITGFAELVSSTVGVFADTFDTARDAGEGLFSAIVKGAKGAGGALSNFARAGAAGFAGIAAGAALLGIILPPLVSLLGALAGGVVALAGSAFFALSSSLVGLAGVLLPLGGLITGVAASIYYFSQNSEELEKELKPLTDVLEDLSEAVGKPIFDTIIENTEEFESILRSLLPLMRALGQGISGFIEVFSNSLQSQAFQNFLDTFSEFLPGAMRKFGQIASNAFLGLTGILQAMLPEVNRFLIWLRDITGEFREWANSEKGREEIVQFFENARDSAKEWGELLSDVVDLFTILFESGGRKTGDDLVSGISGALQDLIDKLKENPEAVEEWFGDVEKILDALGRLVAEVTEFIAKFDSPESRAAVAGFFGGMADFISTVNDLLDTVDHTIGVVKAALSSIELPDIDWSSLLPNRAFNIPGASIINITGIAGIVADIAGKFAGLGGRILNAIGDVNISDIIKGVGGAIDTLLGPFKGMAGRILDRISPVNVSGIISGVLSAVGSLLSPFRGIAERIYNIIAPVDVSGILSGIQKAVNSLLDPFKGIAEDIYDLIAPVDVSDIISGVGAAVESLIDPFRGLADRIEDAIGTIIPRFQMPNIPRPDLNPFNNAEGGIKNGAQWAIVAEAGPEAIVPLSRPLSQVDPSVRWLSAIAQGALPFESGGVMSPGKTINANITVVTPTTDPEAVATETINQLVAVGGY